MLVIEWKSDGYKDLLPSWWFDTEGEWSLLTYDVQLPTGGRSPARCSLKVQGNAAELDYGGDHTAFNEGRFDIGTTRLIFTSRSRTEVAEVQWRYAGEENFEPFEVAILKLETPLEGLEHFSPLTLKDGRKKVAQMVALRQGQPAFRNALMDAYERRCAITGCDIAEVLEAAHISPYLGEETNRVRNGLLLRADIHTLFDRGLIRVDRNYRIDAPAHIRTAYDLPDTIRLPSNADLHPHPDALDIKWNESAKM